MEEQDESKGYQKRQRIDGEDNNKTNKQNIKDGEGDNNVEGNAKGNVKGNVNGNVEGNTVGNVDGIVGGCSGGDIINDNIGGNASNNVGDGDVPVNGNDGIDGTAYGAVPGGDDGHVDDDYDGAYDESDNDNGGEADDDDGIGDDNGNLEIIPDAISNRAIKVERSLSMSDVEGDGLSEDGDSVENADASFVSTSSVFDDDRVMDAYGYSDPDPNQSVDIVDNADDNIDEDDVYDEKQQSPTSSRTDNSTSPNKYKSNDNISVGHSPRGPYERAWSNEATRSLIHIRGPMEDKFREGSEKRTALWLQCTRLLQKVGYRFNAAKVQKKWHNILITYNKNLRKKQMTGHVNWEFFEDMFKYLKGKQADAYGMKISNVTAVTEYEDAPGTMATSTSLFYQQQQQQEIGPLCSGYRGLNMQSLDYYDGLNKNSKDIIYNNDDNLIQIKEEPLDEDDYTSYVYDSNGRRRNYTNYTNDLNTAFSVDGIDIPNFGSSSEPNIPKTSRKRKYEDGKSYPAYVTSNPSNNDANIHGDWWQEYLGKKLKIEAEKVEVQKQLQKEYMKFNRILLEHHEKMERLKTESIQCLTESILKLSENMNWE